MSAPGFLTRRQSLIDSTNTNTFRLINGAADGHSGLYLDKFGDYLLAQSEAALTAPQFELIRLCAAELGSLGTYHKTLQKHVRKLAPELARPKLVDGTIAPDAFRLRENGVVYEASFREGYSIGLFLDQRENRSTWKKRQLPHAQNVADTPHLLNCFAYTCAFSVAAALGGWQTTSLDLSRKYLDWGRRNFEANGVARENHDFIYGDAFEWLKRLAKKGRQFEAVVLDPPTFSKAKNGTQFKADQNYGELVKAAMSVLTDQGLLFVSTNAAKYPKSKFLDNVEFAILDTGYKIESKRFVPQPSDFPVSSEEPAYLKTCWYEVAKSLK